MTRREMLAVWIAAVGTQREISAAEVKGVKALVFDVFGTVVDWRSSVIRECEALARRKNLKADWAAFADRWRAGYGPGMDRIRKGELPWMKLDEVHRMILDRLLEEFHISGLNEVEKDHLNRAWHRLDPWPDAVAGLGRLKTKFIIATLSNGNVSLLTNMAKHAGLPWDCILSAELARHYKPDREVYLMAADLLGLKTGEVAMVAAHKGDLRAAMTVGMKSAYVPRPLEGGPGGKVEPPDSDFDVVAKDFVELAEKMGA